MLREYNEEIKSKGEYEGYKRKWAKQKKAFKTKECKATERKAVQRATINVNLKSKNTKDGYKKLSFTLFLGDANIWKNKKYNCSGPPVFKS